MKSNIRKFLDVGIRHHVKLCILGYIGGLFWLALLAHPSVSNKTYFSENALLPGMVDLEDNAHMTRNLKEVKNLAENDRGLIAMWLIDKMSTIGLEVYQQNFTVQIPVELSKQGRVVGNNIYGILRAPRIAGTEALVFSVPFKGEQNGPFYELVLMLSLAQQFRNNIYWSKDIIFLVTEHQELGMQIWLDGYHGIFSPYVQSSPMLGRSGAIQEAINLELDDKEVSHMQILVQGLNGQLPNLDMVNMVIRLCEMEQIHVSLKTLHFSHLNDGWDEYRSSLGTMGMMMFNQASGRPSSNHGLFHKYGIEAVTLKGIRGSRGGSVGFHKLGRALEGMFRSLNNLLERFHQSFFFYLLPSTHRYVSIGLYMPPLGCLIVGPLCTAVVFWILSVKEEETTGSCKQNDAEQSESGNLSRNENNEDKTESTNNKENEQSAKKGEEKDGKKCEEPQEEVAFTRIPRRFGKVLRIFLAAHVVGLLIYHVPQVSQYIQPVPFNLQPSDFCVVALMTSFLFSLVLPSLLSLSSTLTTRDVMLLKCFALVVYSCCVGCLATVNFSFGYFLAVFTIPSFLFVSSTKSKLRRPVQVILVLISSPPGVLFTLTLIYSYLTSQQPYNYEQLFSDATSLFTNSILSAIRDSFLFGAWSYAVTTLILLPNWLLFWCIAWS